MPVLHKIGNFVKYCKENVEKFYKYESLKKDIVSKVEDLESEHTTKDIDIEYNNYIIEDNLDCDEELINDIKNLSCEKQQVENFKYPKLVNKNPKLYGVGNRLIKKCKSWIIKWDI